MSVSEAEEVVEQLGEGGMLSLEKGVIDSTTEEGRDRLKELEREARQEKEIGEPGDVEEEEEEEEEEAEAALKQLDVEEKGEADEVQIADVD